MNVKPNIRTFPHRLAAWALLGAFAVYAPSAAALSLFDLIQMTQGGYEEEEILRLMDVTGARFELDADGLKALREAEVSLTIIHRLLDDGGVAPEVYSAVDAEALSALLEAGFTEATILKYVRHRQVCEPLDEATALQLAEAGFTTTFFDGFGELIAECQAARLARAPVEPALPPSAYAEQTPAHHHEPAQTAHTVIIREAPRWRDHYWRDHYYDHLHYRRYPTWYPVYIYSDHRARDRHRHDRRHRFDRDRRHRLDRDRRHRGDRNRHHRDRGDRDRGRRHAVTETERGDVLATRPRQREPWVSTRPAPLDGPPTRLLPARSERTVAKPKETPAPVPRGRRTPTFPAEVTDGLAPGALSGLPIRSASPRSVSRAAPVNSPVRAHRPTATPQRPTATARSRPAAVAPTPRRIQPRIESRDVARMPGRPAAVPRSAPPPRAVSRPMPSRIAPTPRNVAPPRPVAQPRAIAPPPRAVAPPPKAKPRPVAPRREVAPRAPRRDEVRPHR